MLRRFVRNCVVRGALGPGLILAGLAGCDAIKEPKPVGVGPVGAGSGSATNNTGSPSASTTPAGQTAAIPAVPSTAGQATAGQTPAANGGTAPGATASSQESALYGETGGETPLAADPGIPDTLLRARKTDTFYQLSNARFENDRFGRPGVRVDYEKTRIGPQDGVTLMIHTAEGQRSNVILFGALTDTRGTIGFSFQWPPPIGSRGTPKDMELYLVRTDSRYGVQNAPTFKVSNSTTLGTMNRLTKIRNWTPEEIQRLSSPPPNWAHANAHPQVGSDTAFLGSEGGFPQRYVEPNGRLLGLEYRLGEWDKEKCIGGLTPVFTRDQPTTLPARVAAKEGYAVCGIKVHTKKLVDAIQLIYAKVGADGKLNLKDTYESEWIGYPEEGVEPKTLPADGVNVIGVVSRQGAVLNAVALVKEKK